MPPRSSRFAGVLLSCFAAGPLQAQQAPSQLADPPPRPAVQRVLERDSVVVLGSRERWHMDYVEVDQDEATWVRLSDPYGGEVLVESFLLLSIGADLDAFLTQEQERSVLSISPSWFALLAGVLFVGLLSLTVAPIVLLKRSLRRESARHRRGEQVRGQLTASQEAERTRIARDLHDGPIQDLLALQMRLNVLARTQPPSTAPTAQVSAAAETAGYIADDLRSVSENLRPPSLEPFGLVAALQAFAQRFGRLHPRVEVAFQSPGGEPDLPGDVRLALFRIAQEAMNNAARHAAPSRVELVLRSAPSGVTLRVTDDGTGFDVPEPLNALATSRHYGLLGMAERAAQIGAALDVTSAPEQGTTVEARLPADAEARRLHP